jgi:hypothetical protein
MWLIKVSEDNYHLSIDNHFCDNQCKECKIKYPGHHLCGYYSTLCHKESRRKILLDIINSKNQKVLALLNCRNPELIFPGEKINVCVEILKGNELQIVDMPLLARKKYYYAG